MRRQFALRAVSILLVASLARPVLAQEEVILVIAGKWIAGQIAGYLTGKAIDRLTGNDFDKKLKQTESRIQGQLQRANGDKAKLYQELQAARTQRAALGVLLQSKPDRNELMLFKSKVQANTAELQRRLDSHEKRINSQEGRITHQGGRLDSHDKRLEELEQRVGRLDNYVLSDRQPSVDNTTDGLSENVKPVRPSTEHPFSADPVPTNAYRQRRGSGVTLDVWISGRHNDLQVEETKVEAQTGTLNISDSGKRLRLRMRTGTGAVINVLGEGNRICVPPELRKRVRIVDKGRVTSAGCDSN